MSSFRSELRDLSCTTVLGSTERRGGSSIADLFMPWTPDRSALISSRHLLQLARDRGGRGKCFLIVRFSAYCIKMDATLRLASLLRRPRDCLCVDILTQFCAY